MVVQSSLNSLFVCKCVWKAEVRVFILIATRLIVYKYLKYVCMCMHVFAHTYAKVCATVRV